MSSPLHQLRAHIVDQLKAHPAFENVSVIGSLTEDAEAAIRRELDQLGVCCYVFQPLPVEIGVDVAAADCVLVEQTDIRLRLISDLLLNPQTDLFELIADAILLLHNHDPEIEDVGRILVPERPLTQVDDPQLEIYDLVFHTTAILRKS